MKLGGSEAQMSMAMEGHFWLQTLLERHCWADMIHCYPHVRGKVVSVDEFCSSRADIDYHVVAFATVSCHNLAAGAVGWRNLSISPYEGGVSKVCVESRVSAASVERLQKQQLQSPSPAPLPWRCWDFSWLVAPSAPNELTSSLLNPSSSTLRCTPVHTTVHPAHQGYSLYSLVPAYLMYCLLTVFIRRTYPFAMQEMIAHEKSLYSHLDYEYRAAQNGLHDVTRRLHGKEAELLEKANHLRYEKDEWMRANTQLQMTVSELHEQLSYERAIVEAHKKKLEELEAAHSSREKDWHDLAAKWRKYEADANAENARLLGELAHFQKSTSIPKPATPLPEEEPQLRPETQFKAQTPRQPALTAQPAI
ncbi:uncharacterized protein HaLaN_25563 [Haematococcus lacustris]|uniref:Uncharacterized protein n=1 Tax=Haematococcus lacustris TaxID=44745 RepID=A0A699ZWH7_HAELA|nr:uncharacterized protein HaLaN_25563 [Haematococcus lacustris]